MGNKGYFETVVSVAVSAILILVSCFLLYTSMKDLEVQIEELQKTIELQDEEINDLRAKNVLLKDEINSLEIFDCTFKKFPELRDQLLIETFKGDLDADDKRSENALGEVQRD